MKYSKRLKKDLLQETNGRCFYCGIELKDKYHIEHIHPRSLDHSQTRDKLTVACPPCNKLKRDLSVDEFRYLLENKLHKKIEFFFEKYGIIKTIDGVIYLSTLNERAF